MAKPMTEKCWSKTDFRYWESRVYRPRVDGKNWEGSFFHVRIQHEGRRGSFSTGEGARRKAAKKAVELFLFLKANGWDAAIANFRNDRPEEGARPITVGEYIAQAEAIACMGARTFADYKRSFRRIVADIAKVKESGRSRFDYKAGGRDEWIAKIDGVSLVEITPERIRTWANAFVKQAGNEPLAEKRAKNSANSMMRQAKSLFGTRLLPHVRNMVDSEPFALPERLPFDGVAFFKRSSSRYHSKINPEKLLLAAKSELPAVAPEAWKIFLLALGVGLRRSEIDSLLWRQIDLDRGLIRIEATPYFKPKSEDSGGEVEIDPELVELFRGYKARASGPFVVEARHSPKPSATYSFTRAKEHFETLYGWLRQQGVEDQKPLHVLRKEFGSLICEKFGLYAASKALRHADIGVTASYYLDKKKPVTIGLGSLLTEEAVEINSARAQQFSNQ